MSQVKLTIGVIFGSRSVEHDVSVVTATQVLKALNASRYNIVPIYITRDGRWFTGDNLNQVRNFLIDDIADLNGTEATALSPSTAFQGLITPPLSGRMHKNTLQAIDVFFPVVHGSHGEDGTLQGLFELVNLPYVGTGVMSSAIANDKGMTKLVLKAQGIPVVEQSLTFSRREWMENRADILQKIESEVGYPAFVKPLTLGSSIGIARVNTSDKIGLYIDIALNMDTHVLVEKGIVGDNIVEINCAVMGNDTIRASALEQPIIGKAPDIDPNHFDDLESFLNFKEKYMKQAGKGMKGQDRMLPAPLGDEMTANMKQTAIETFKAIRGRGTARIDFLANPDTGEYWVNEINTMPGSLAFYLWEPEGLSASDVCDELIMLAREAHANKLQTTFDYQSGLLELAATRGSKGGKT